MQRIKIEQNINKHWPEIKKWAKGKIHSSIKEESVWGQNIIEKKTNQWTTTLGEYTVKEALKRLKLNPKKPIKKECKLPDWEADDCIYEVKTRNWNTTGTAGEKVMGVPYKYAEVPRLYGKPLKVVLVAYQEEEYINGKNPIFNDDISPEKKEMLQFWKTRNIEFVKFTDILKLIEN